jgi:Tat protein secretion system quality control protein TatD with DNase activity
MSGLQQTNYTSSSNGPSCPCCLFFTDDLFLPPSERADALVEANNDGKDDNSTAGEPMSPLACWELLTQSKSSDNQEFPIPAVVDTHGHAHLNRDSQDVYALSTYASIVSLTCAVEPTDWKACLDYAAVSPHRMAAIGVHPWYLADLPVSWLTDLESLLKEHPGCMVGEIGLCKMARFVRTYAAGKQAALQLQREVFFQQLKLAGKYRRPVSIHCVNQQGVLLEVLKEEKNNLPPAMALHSFSGTAHQVKQLLQWESSLKLSSPLLYFGFSHAINYVMSTSEKARRQGCLAIRQVPPDRLLAESDVHSDADVAVGTAGAVAYLAWALDEPLAAVADRTRLNGLRFLQKLDVTTATK